MPKSVKKAAIIPEASEENTVQPQPEEPKRKRKMSPEALEQLRIAREKAIEARRKAGQVNHELLEIRKEIKKEKLGDRVDEVETYHKIKQRVEDEVKANEIVSINNKLNDMYSKFDTFLQDREKRKQEKAIRKQEKNARQIAQELPMAISKQMLEEELKKEELARFRKRVFGY